MFDLTRQEKIILIFLSLSFISGLGISAYKKTQKKPQLGVRPYEMTALQDADKFIAQQRFININSFEIDELTRLAGVGEKIAERIAEYHKLHGPFKSKEDLMRVKGIGGKKFEKLKDSIILE